MEPLEFRTCQTCPVCGVRVVLDEQDPSRDQVLFSFGKPGTRGKLWARVCNYIQKDKDKREGCINKGYIDAPGATILPSDFYPLS